MLWFRAVELLFVLILQLTLTEAVKTCKLFSQFPTGCRCTYGNRDVESTINCQLNTTTNLKQMFDTLADVFDDTDATFETLSLYPVSSIKKYPVFSDRAMSKTLKFRRIQLRAFDDAPLEIHPNAFPSTYDYTQILLINSTNFDTRNHPQRFFKNFKKLEGLYIKNGEIPTIPDNAFDGMKNLQIISYESTRLESIGSKAFTNLPKLQTLTLYSNSFKPNDISKQAFTGINPWAKVNLLDNLELTYLPQSTFKQLLDTTHQPVDLKKIITLMVCDDEADWICNNAATYKSKLRGFDCLFYDVFEYCKIKRDLTLRPTSSSTRTPLFGTTESSSSKSNVSLSSGFTVMFSILILAELTIFKIL